MIATDGRQTIANAARIKDFALQYDGSIALLQPLTAAGKAWLEENTEPEAWQHFGRWIAIDRHCIVDIVDAIFDAGLTIE